jgi:peptide/nickel transport system permease protein
VFLIASLNFFLFQVLPGDPTRVLLPKGCGGSNVTSCTLREELRKEWGLDQPVFNRYVIYMTNLLEGNLGKSITFRQGTPVATVIAQRLPITLLLVGLATVVSLWLGIILGRISGWRRGRAADILITLSTLFGYSMPAFWVGLLLLFYLSVAVPVFPVSGDRSVNFSSMNLGSQIVDMGWHLVLPVLTFVITNIAWFSLTLRNSLTDVLPEDYMVTANAKGLTETQQLRRHALPNARLPLVTAAALYFGWVVSGAIVIEQIFAINGLGQLEWEATLSLDYPLMSGIFLIAALGVVIANAVADILYMLLDPRVREA